MGRGPPLLIRVHEQNVWLPFNYSRKTRKVLANLRSFMIFVFHPFIPSLCSTQYLENAETAPLTEDREKEDQHELHFERGIPILPGKAEREEHARHTEQKEEREFKKEQSAIQRGIFRTQLALVVFGILSAGVSAYQAWTAKLSADAARQSSEVAVNQFWQAVGNINWLANTMDRSQKVIETGIKDSNSQAKQVLQTDREGIRLEERPWVSIVSLESAGPIARGIDTSGHKTADIPVQYRIQNSGKSPAIATNLSIEFVPIRTNFCKSTIQTESSCLPKGRVPVTDPDEELQRMCSDQSERAQLSRTYRSGIWSGVILPNEILKSRTTTLRIPTEYYTQDDYTLRNSAYLLVCTTYRFAFESGSHYTGIVFRLDAVSGQDLFSNPIPEEEITLRRDLLSPGIAN